MEFVVLKIFEVVDDSDVEGAARATCDFLADTKIVLGYLEEIAAGAWVRVRLQFLVPLHVFDLNIVVRHRFHRNQNPLPVLGSLLFSSGNNFTNPNFCQGGGKETSLSVLEEFLLHKTPFALESLNICNSNFNPSAQPSPAQPLLINKAKAQYTGLYLKAHFLHNHSTKELYKKKFRTTTSTDYW